MLRNIQIRTSEDLTTQRVDLHFVQQSEDCAYNPRIYIYI